MSKRKYTNEDLIKYAAESTSCADLLRRLNLSPKGGNYSTVKKHLSNLRVTCSHWKGQAWSSGLVLKDFKEYKSTAAIKKHLIKNLGNKCESCNLTEWLDRPITIEIHHIDGDRSNNSLENLSLLCPNCHSYTDNFRRKRNVNTHIVIARAKDCPKKEKYVHPTKIIWPSKEDLEKMIKDKSMASIGRSLGVSCNSVRKRARKYGIIKTA